MCKPRDTKNSRCSLQSSIKLQLLLGNTTIILLSTNSFFHPIGVGLTFMFNGLDSNLKRSHFVFKLYQS